MGTVVGAADDQAVAVIRRRLDEARNRFVSLVGDRVGVNLDRLVAIAAQVCAEQTAQLRAERAALWQMLKEQTRGVRELRTEIANSETTCWALDGMVTDLQIELNRLDAKTAAATSAEHKTAHEAAPTGDAAPPSA